MYLDFHPIMSQDGGSARDSRRLSPPSFELPDDMGDCEMWTVRFPSSVDIHSLQGLELDLNSNTSLATFQAGETDYTVTRGAASENEQFRLLLRDDNLMRPYERPFDGHFNVSVSARDMAETQLAPRLETAPTPADTVRQSYSHVPQLSGLKRRWMPPGGGSVPAAAIQSTSKDSSEPEINGVKDVSSHKRRKATEHSETTLGASKTSGDAPSEVTASASIRGKDDDVQMNGDHSSSKKKSKKDRKKEKKAKKEKKKRSKSKDRSKKSEE